MVTDELTRLLHADDAVREGAPDLNRIRRLGRRRRVLVRSATAAVVLATVAATGGTWAVLARGGAGSSVPAAAQDHRVTGLTAYERRVLREVPGSYAVDGTVVVPGTPTAGSAMNQVMPADRLRGEVEPLGFHAYGGGAIGGPDGAYPRFMQGNPPKDSQVIADQGPAYLGCTLWKDQQLPLPCVPSVLVKDTSGALTYAYGLGTDDFLQPGSEMELFTADDWTDRRWSPSLLGGFPGDTTARVVVELVDGSEAEAQFDAGGHVPGATLFWARLPAQVAVVRAYDASGTLLAEHRLRACTTATDCEVR